MSHLKNFTKRHNIKVNKSTGSREGNLQDRCVAHLEKLSATGYPVVWNVRWSGGIYTRSGFPDLEVWINSQHLDIELKDKSFVSTVQTDKISKIKSTNNPVYVTSTIGEFRKIIERAMKGELT